MDRKPSSYCRSFERVRIAVPIRFCVAGQAELPSLKEGETIDLSCGGLLMRCEKFSDPFLDDLVKEDNALRLQFLLRSGQWVKSMAKVVWMEPYKDGQSTLVRVCFVGLPLDTARIIDEFLEAVSV